MANMEQNDLNARLRSMILDNARPNVNLPKSNSNQLSYNGQHEKNATRKNNDSQAHERPADHAMPSHSPGTGRHHNGTRAHGRGRGLTRKQFEGHRQAPTGNSNARQVHQPSRVQQPVLGILQNPSRHSTNPHNASPSFPGSERGDRRGSRPFNHRNLIQSRGITPEEIQSQSHYLESVANEELPKAQISPQELDAKSRFRTRIQDLCKNAIATARIDCGPLDLVPFGSLASGFCTPGSDLDLALMAATVPPDMPRILERALLEAGLGARLLTRTRVPILKLCEKPTESLYQALREEREKWDMMTPAEKEDYDRGPLKRKEPNKDPVLDGEKGQLTVHGSPARDYSAGTSPTSPRMQHDDVQQNKSTVAAQSTKTGVKDGQVLQTSNCDALSEPTRNLLRGPQKQQEPPMSEHEQYSRQLKNAKARSPGGVEQWLASHPPPAGFDLKSALYAAPTQRKEKPWLREKPLGLLDFPKETVGILSDINFSNPLGIQNTALLHAYSVCDARVRLMVILVKVWAARRKINSGYNGTLSSYGYVLMVLHFLVNVASPPVCPNLQLWETQRVEHTNGWGAESQYIPPDPSDPTQVCEGADVRFYRDETQLASLAQRGLLTHNRATLGNLLREFFVYYATQGFRSPKGGFNWTRDVLSLRSPGGLLNKIEKGWTGARTTEEEGGKEIRHRYLFAIEDPFELEHNVARTVTHFGIVAIRDEFRRCARMLESVGRGERLHEELLAEMIVKQPSESEHNSTLEKPEDASTAIEGKDHQQEGR